MLSRRGVLVGLLSVLAAPAIVKASALMPVRSYKVFPNLVVPPWCPTGWVPCNGLTVSKDQFPELHAWYSRTRQYGAHGSDTFTLPESSIFSHKPYPYKGGQLQIAPERAKGVRLPIVNTVSMRASNGRLVKPGMIAEVELH